MILNTDLTGCARFIDSPCAGECNCYCSYCMELIKFDDVPIRLFLNDGKDGEYRFHDICFHKIITVKNAKKD